VPEWEAGGNAPVRRRAPDSRKHTGGVIPARVRFPTGTFFGGVFLEVVSPVYSTKDSN